MAPGLKWTATCLAGGALMGVLALDAGPERPAPRPDVLAELREDVGLRIRETEELLERHHVMAAARALLPAEGGARVVIADGAQPPPRNVADSVAERWRLRADSALAAFETHARRRMGELDAGTDARVLLLATSARGGFSGASPFRTVHARFHAGRDDRGEFCVAAIYDAAWGGYDAPDGPSAFGPCRFWLRYGAPGPSVRQWLGGAGHLLDLEAEPIAPFDGPRRTVFGIRENSGGFPVALPPVEACLAGRKDRCGTALLDGSVWTFDTLAATVRQGALHLRGPRPLAMQVAGLAFTEIERELGSERFARFWNAEGPAQRALEAELGRDFDDWSFDFLRARLGREPLGPRVPLNTLLATLATIAGLVGVAAAVAERRRPS